VSTIFFNDLTESGESAANEKANETPEGLLRLLTQVTGSCAKDPGLSGKIFAFNFLQGSTQKRCKWEHAPLLH
jgi:hypothetical protein